MTGKGELPGNTRGFLLVPVMFTFIFLLVLTMVLLDISSGTNWFYVKISPIAIFGMVMVITWIDWAAMNQKMEQRTARVVKTISLIIFLVISTLILFNILPP